MLQLKQVKQKLGLEVQRERHNAQVMEQEAITARKQTEELAKELRIAQEAQTNLRDQLKTEQTKNITLYQENVEIKAAELRTQNSCIELQTRAKLAEERAAMVEQMKDKELAIAEGKIKLEAERMMESERSQVDRRTATYHLQYQNELGLLKNKIRNSYAYGESLPAPAPRQGQVFLLDDSVSDSKASWAERGDADRLIQTYKTRLEEAAGNIERLKRMVVEYRSKAEAVDSDERLSAALEDHKAALNEQKAASDKKIIDLRSEVLRAKSVTDQISAEYAQKEQVSIETIAGLRLEIASLKQELIEVYDILTLQSIFH